VLNRLDAADPLQQLVADRLSRMNADYVAASAGFGDVVRRWFDGVSPCMETERASNEA
jgi:hypothetical protein